MVDDAPRQGFPRCEIQTPADRWRTATALIEAMNKAKILIVDDDAKISSLLGLILRRNGYDVREENRSFAALATARDFRPQLALLDVDMPGKDGGSVAAELAADREFAHMPVVFVTSLVRPNEAGMHGSARFLSKPVDVSILLATVREILPSLAA